MDKQAENPISVLLVDDHEMVRMGMRSMLTDPGIQVVGEAGSAAEAIDQVDTLEPAVILMDIRMPDMDGIEALEAIKLRWPDIKVIMVTTYRNTSYLLRSLAAGAAGFVLKDIPREQMLSTVRDVATGAARVDRHFLQSVLRNLDEESPNQQSSTKLAESLTDREMDVLRLLVEGMTNQAIAHTLQLSPTTVKGYVQTLFQKLEVSDRTQAAVKAIRLGVVK